MAACPAAKPFGSLPDGRAAHLFELASSFARVRVTDYGARLVSIEIPDRHGRHGHVLLGFDDASSYATAGGSFGAVLGRFANRIAGARFALDGQIHHLAANNGPNILHGGLAGFGMVPWRAVPSDQPGTVIFALTSNDGDQGFPGKVEARATYALHEAALRLTLEAATDRPTVVNLSSHPYFNLAGVERHDVLAHEITIHADQYLPTDQRQIPTGALEPVAGTPFDFRHAQPIGARIREAHPQLLYGRGYDHCFVLRGGRRDGLRLAARVHEPLTSRGLEVLTTQPGLQFYSGNMLTGAVAGRGGVAYRQSSGFALEAQNFPDAPNQPGFPSAVLRPGERYVEVIEYRFTLQA